MNLHIPFPIMTSTFPFPCYYLCLLCPLSFQLVIFPVLHDLHRFPIFFHIYLIIHTLFVFLRQILSHSKYLSFTQPNQIAFLIPWPNPDNNSKSTPLFSLTEGVVHTQVSTYMSPCVLTLYTKSVLLLLCFISSLQPLLQNTNQARIQDTTSIPKICCHLGIVSKQQSLPLLQRQEEAVRNLSTPGYSVFVLALMVKCQMSATMLPDTRYSIYIIHDSHIFYCLNQNRRR